MRTTSPVPGWSGARLAGLLTLLLACAAEVRGIKHKPSAEANDHAEAVLIKSRNARNQKDGSCSGVLIAPDVVLTAAHAVDGFDTWEVTAPYAKGGPFKARSKTVKFHPNHRVGTFENDLAVLILDAKIDIGRKLPTLYGGALLPINTKLLVIGRTDNGSISNTKLFLTPATRVQFPDNINVYGGNPQLVERGDSGGPVFVAGKEQEIVGLISGYVEFSLRNVATDLYVPITPKNREWILQQVPRDGKAAK